MSATLFNMPSPSQAPTFSEEESGPGTPMSGISTIAIKDGHEGHRPNSDGTSGADRIQRLGLGMGYFDQGLPRSTNSSASTPGMYTPGQLTPGYYTPGTAPGEKRGSPASSTVTTNSTLEATKEAKMIDGMTYDEGVVDTTVQRPLPVLNKEKEQNGRKKFLGKDSGDQMEGVEPKTKI